MSINHPIDDPQPPTPSSVDPDESGLDEPVPPVTPPPLENPQPGTPDEPLAPHPSEPEPFVDGGGATPGQADPGGAGGAKVL
jgi:hypothetical protein